MDDLAWLAPLACPPFAGARLRAMKTTIAFVALTLAAAPIAAAQITVTKVLASAKQTEPTPADLHFFGQGAESSAYELKMAELAAEQASSEKLRRYAKTVAEDDRAYLQALRDLARQCYLDLPSPLSDDEEETIAALQDMKGPAFDRAYAEAASKTADADTKLSEYEAATTYNPHIRYLIAKYGQIKESHQEQAK